MDKRKFTVQNHLQRWVLSLGSSPIFRPVFSAYYAIAIQVFLRFVVAANDTKQGNKKLSAVSAVYLRRGGGRGELLPGASDLDFFLVLEEMGSQEEMIFLKNFWDSFRFWKKFFPFLGETLMADRNEFSNWFLTPTVRSFEAPHSWILLSGEALLPKVQSNLPELRDVFSECAKAYWMILLPLFRAETLSLGREPLVALDFRNSAKASVDFFRMVHSLGPNPKWEGGAREALWRESRLGVVEKLSSLEPRLRELIPFLRMRGPYPKEEEIFALFASLAFGAFCHLDRMARELQGIKTPTVPFEPIASHERLGKDKYSFAVRELFAERMILRHSRWVRRVLVADETTHIFFPFEELPPEDAFLGVLRDLREAGTSFNRSSVAIPITEFALKELERTSFLDSPFHSFLRQQEISLGKDGEMNSTPYRCLGHDLPMGVLHKTFAEVSLALRFQPPPDFFYVVENLITLVLQLRVAEEDGKVPVSFYGALEQYAKRHPLRGDYIKEQVGKYLNLCHEDEDHFWSEVYVSLGRLRERHPHRAFLLEAQLGPLRDSRFDADWKLQKATTDLWIQMTPFLRLEMNALRERYLKERAVLRI